MNQSELNEQQKKALQEFRDHVGDVLSPHHDDTYLLRWLRARSFDVTKAETMLRKSLKWRSNFGADEITSWQMPEVLRKYSAGGPHGYDKNASPIFIEPNGQLDINGLVHSVSKNDLIRYTIHLCEMMMNLVEEQAKKIGRPPYEVGEVIIFDLENYGLKNLKRQAISHQKMVFEIFEAHYPELLKTCYVVNAPRIFPYAYNVFKPFLSEQTRRKVVVLGRNWKQELLKHIDADQLPVNWGGTATDPDGDTYCRSKVPMGGVVPTEYYIQKVESFDMSKFTQTIIRRGSMVQVVKEITKPDSIIKWQFWTEAKDLGFGLFYYNGQENGKKYYKTSEMEGIFETQRVNCHMVPEEGNYCCTRLGKYVLTFDNSFSWISSKRLSYLVEVLEESDISDIQISPFFSNEHANDATTQAKRDGEELNAN